ncbi:MAG: hypothetical protein FJX74_23180 [Armatimonadetes bacterium]|nr:hypothetical protein [Armatimonadota bacterium]
MAVGSLSAEGGRGAAIREFTTYQRARVGGIGTVPDVVVVAIDANCHAATEARAIITRALRPEFADLCIPACPDPHIERWYLADLQAFHEVVGHTPHVPEAKCERDLYKGILAQAVVEAGHPATLGGIEFARELAEAMDLVRAGRAVRSLGRFIGELRARLRLV